MTNKELLSELHKRLDYNRERGELRRKAGFLGVIEGALVGSPDSSNTLQATFCKKRYMVHSLIWLIEHKTFPQGVLIHKNGNNLDNRIGNLMDCSRKEVARYSKKTQTYIKKVKQEASERRKQRKIAIEQRKRDRVYKTKEEKRRTAQIHRDNNRELYNKAAKRFYWKNKNNSQYKATRACRQLLNQVLASCKTGRVDRTESLLGYTFKQFQEHIENQFKADMQWSNHGTWHVDHIKPVSVFITEGVIDPKIINALNNLRPLAARENLIKNKYYYQKGTPRPAPRAAI